MKRILMCGMSGNTGLNSGIRLVFLCYTFPALDTILCIKVMPG